MKKILCLDFDGVICDSQEECLLVSYNAYNSFENSSFVRIYKVSQIPKQITNSFFNYRYLVRPAGEYWLLMDSLIKRNKIPNQSNFDNLANNNELTIIDFEPFFFEERNRFRQENLNLWYSLHKIFPEFLNYANELVSQYKIYIVTNKDYLSVSALLEYFDIPINSDKIWGQEMNMSKIKKLESIVKLENTSKENIIFIDDHPDYVELMLGSGIKSYLASWGYNKKGKNFCSNLSSLLKN